MSNIFFRNPKIDIPIISLFGLALIVLAFQSWKRQQSLEKDHSITVAKITNLSPGYKGGIEFEYVFQVNGKEYSGERKILISYGYREYFVDKYFPLIYAPANIENNRIIIKPDDFDASGMQFPDSLSWVKKIFKDNRY